MMAKRSKYDTNPLDPEVAERAEQAWGDPRPGPPTEEVGGPTSDIGRAANEAARSHPESEAPTRRIGNDLPSSYPSIFIPPTYQRPVYQPPPAYQPPVPTVLQKPASCKVAGLGIPERWAAILPYIPGYIGAVLAAIELVIAPRGESRTRFHAAQGLALQLAIMTISIMLRFLSIGLGSSVGSGLFRIAAFIFLIVSMVRVWQGKPHQIAPLADAANWLNQRIAPRG